MSLRYAVATECAPDGRVSTTATVVVSVVKLAPFASFDGLCNAGAAGPSSDRLLLHARARQAWVTPVKNE
jgi:hypothetical protein